MTGKQQGGAGAEQAACDAAKTFTDHAADGGKADHRRGRHRPVGLIKIQRIGDTQRKTHRDAVAQCVPPLRPGGFNPWECAPRQGLQVHYCPPIETVQVVPETVVTSAGSVSKAIRTGTRWARRTRDIWFDVGHQPGSLFHALVDNRAADAGDMAL